MIVLQYEGGNIFARGSVIPYGIRDSQKKLNKVPAFRYGEIIEYLEQKNIEYLDNACNYRKNLGLKSKIKLRKYQEKALKAWKNEGFRGIIVLPTGAGKTIIALKAIEELNASTLIVVPTLVLVEQWRQQLQKTFGIEIGVLGGGTKKVRDVTVSTYDSASIRAKHLGNRFNLVIFDEVHHLPAASYRQIGLMYLAPYRLGLTATLNRENGSHISLFELVGEKVYEVGIDELSGTHLSDYTVNTIHVPLSNEEHHEYSYNYEKYRDFLKKRNIKIRSVKDYQRFVMRSGRDPEARKALMARNRAMNVALNASSKVEYLKQLLESNPDDKILIFTRHNSLVYRISKDMLIPAITHQTPKEERNEILEKFKIGLYNIIVTSQVLDEGVDVPDASMAIILSGTGSSRQFVQRLGRVLRKKEGKKAKLLELVSKGTFETRISRRRKKR